MPVRHEARWIQDDAAAGRRRSGNRWWILIILVALGLVATLVGYRSYWNFQTVTYELRACAEPLTADSSWDDVQAAGCDPAPADGVELRLREQASLHDPDSVSGSTFSFEGFPVNSPAHGVELQGVPRAGGILIAEPTNQRIRREMSGDVSGTIWTGHTGSRGPTEYWLLMSPPADG